MGRTKRNRSEDLSDGGTEPESDVPKKKAKKVSATKASSMNSGKDDKEQKYWELDNPKRRATVTRFKEAFYVDFREFYEKDGERLPGKKGISLSVEQYNALLEVIPEINAELVKSGQKVGTVAAAANSRDGEEDKLAPQRRVKAKPVKANIEATSEEDDESE